MEGGGRGGRPRPALGETMPDGRRSRGLYTRVVHPAVGSGARGAAEAEPADTGRGGREGVSCSVHFSPFLLGGAGWRQGRPGT